MHHGDYYYLFFAAGKYCQDRSGVRGAWDLGNPNPNPYPNVQDLGIRVWVQDFVIKVWLPNLGSGLRF